MSKPTLDLNLLELPVVDFVSMWPNTFAWKALFAFVVISVVSLVCIKISQYKRDLWRREALYLARIAHERALADEWFVLIKRVYLISTSREKLKEMDDFELLKNITDSMEVRIEMKELHYKKCNVMKHEINDRLYADFRVWLTNLHQIKTTNTF
ncbi:hypothetical protein CGG79_24740 [Vibrio parahaemolyticus]|uniref:DUF4381 family protein n=1 Tax=Vibrio parahaemolyticus TaxID=670 RepID=UPI001120BF8D|nr:DUF4381 family protein [Vibrio parahaemolyticus]TOQ39401.1 hypothetical protein CGG95_24460 [Vibrio parahaemolyticus]TOR22456.1 hypothetical protein CGG79_24740 [Vibrio parahaemolyticus]HCE4563645.1 DUF4381 family protein [Vibrio parahaemolyticus]HCG5611360.1 DUF4381 family protein [Vibrio parahaemolyticus]